jgi:decaprenylphospho-beta-D-erythro-pentofuranosid-2-ulose 2-reductase
VETVPLEATDVGSARAVVEQCFAVAAEPVDMVIVALGTLGPAEPERTDPDRIGETIGVDFTWPAAALGEVAGHLSRQGSGHIVVLSSVAGVRVRRANYLYGAAKAGLDAFALGLAEDLRGSGVRVHVVRPGFVHSKMTSGRRPAPFAVHPDAVARGVVGGVERGR